MINLLPYDTKKQTRAARMNVLILRYIFILHLSAAFLLLSCAVVYFTLKNNKIISTEKVNNNTASSAQTQTGSSGTDIATAKNILDGQVSYSDVIAGIATALPTGTVLDSLSLNDTSFGTTTNLKILSRSADNETKLKENFNNSTLFSNYKLDSTSPNQSNSSGYPYTINISITINKGTS